MNPCRSSVRARVMDLTGGIVKPGSLGTGPFKLKTVRIRIRMFVDILNNRQATWTEK